MRLPAGHSADRLIAANGLPHSDERGAGRYGLPHLVGIQNPVQKSISLPHFWEEEIDEKMQGNGAIELGAHGRTRTAGLLLTKEVLIAQFPNGVLLSSNAGAHNRCLAALPRNSTHQPWKTP